MGVHRATCAPQQQLTHRVIRRIATGFSFVADVTVSPLGLRETQMLLSTMSGLLHSGELAGCEPSLSWLLQAAEVGDTLEIPQTVDGEEYRFHINVELVEGEQP